MIDAELMKQVRKGNELAFAALMNRYAKDLYQLIYRRIASDEDTKDMVQDIFISLWKNREKVTVEDSLFPYLYQAAIYEVIDYQLKHNKEIAFKSELLLQSEPVQASSEEKVAIRELQQEIDAEVARMPDTMRTIFCLSRYERLSVKEIASRLQLSEQTVKNNITMALQRLRSGLHRNQIALFIVTAYWLFEYPWARC